MAQLRDLWSRFSLSQRVTIVVTLLASVAGIWGLAQWNRERDFKPLFVGLSSEEASHIVTKLKESGVEYRLNEDGNRILVPSAQLSELRLKIAGEGLPKTGRLGFELFDKTSLGLTEFAEHVNYQRALEGELERSILGLNEIETVRVHVTPEQESLFEDRRQAAKASIVIKLRPAARLAAGNVSAIQNLTASAIKGLSPEHVTVVDMNGTMLSKRVRDSVAGEQPSEALEFRQQVERDLAEKVNATLEPLLGADKFRVGVFADCDFTSGEQNEEVYDPNKSVMTVSQRTEENATGRPVAGNPGTNSNLPRPTTRNATTSTSNTRRTENITYQTSRMVKHLNLPKGTLKKLSVSVLLDQRVRWEGSGKARKKIVEALPKESLEGIREVVAGVVGINPERGDRLVVQSLPFAATLTTEAPEGAPVPHSAPTPWAQYGPYILAGAGTLLGLASGVLVLARRKKSAKKIPTEVEHVGMPAPELPPAQENLDLTPPEPNLSIEKQIADVQDERERLLAKEVAKLRLPALETPRVAILSRHMSEEAHKTPQAIAQIIRSWMSDQER